MSIGVFRQRTIAKNALLAVVFVLVYQLAFAQLIIFLLHDIDTKFTAERHRLAVISTSSRIANLTQEFGILLIFDLSKDLHNSAAAAALWPSLSSRLEKEFGRLKSLAVNDAAAAEILKVQEQIYGAADAVYREERRHIGDKNWQSKVKLDPSSLVLGPEVSEHYQELLARYKAMAPEQLIAESKTLFIVKGVLAGVCVVDLIFTITLLALFFLPLGKGVTALALNLERYKSEEELEVLPPSCDELGNLDRLLREMIQTLGNLARYETTLIEGALDVIFRIDSEGRIRDLNAAVSSQWGYQPYELEGAPWQTVVPAESRQALRDFLSSLPQLDHSSATELAVKRHDGSLLESRFSCYWSEADQSTFCFVSDICAAKLREEELREKENDVRMLMRNLPIGLVVVDQAGVFLSTNERMEQMLNAYSASSERSVDAVFGDSDVLTKARQVSQLRTQIAGKKNVALDCELTVASLAGVDQTLVVVEDVSEKVKLENLRKDFLQLLWRNLGEPILKVKQMLLGIEVKTEKEQGRVQKFVLNANRLLRLLDELLRLEELAPGKLVGAMVPTKTSDLADSAIASLVDYALNQGIKLEVQVVPLMVLADFERVVQVIVNLISNAIKFSFKGGTVLLRIVPDHGQVEFSVIDNGRGVPLEKQAQIFKAYGQANASDARVGTGLGLAICQSIIEAHGGTIGVESRENKDNRGDGGSRFWFKLPVLEVPLEQ